MMLSKIGKYFLIYSLLFISISLCSFAQDKKVQATLSKNDIFIDEVFTLSIIVNALSASVSPPEIENLVLLGSSQKKEVSYSGGIRSSKTIYIYSYRAQKVGRYNISSIPVRIGGQSYYTNPLILKVNDRQVIPSQNNNTNNSSQNNSFNLFNGRDNLIDEQMFLTSELSKTNVYLYEPVYFEQSIYVSDDIKVDVLGVEKIGDKKNFWVEKDKNQYSSVNRTVNNKLYSLHLLNRGLQPEGKPLLARHMSVAFPCCSSSLEGGSTVRVGRTSPRRHQSA